MSDNIQVTESEMISAWEVFDRMRNQVIEGSKLRVDYEQTKAEMNREFTDLRSKVQALQNELEYLRERNKSLDDIIISTRRQRDEAQLEASNLRAELDTVKTSLVHSNDTVQRKQDQLDVASIQIEQLKKDRDDAELRAMEWEEKAEGFRKKLEAVTTALGLPVPGEAPKPSVEEKIHPEPVAAPEVAEPVPTEPSSGEGSAGLGWETKQPRDPVTQQWRSPYDHD